MKKIVSLAFLCLVCMVVAMAVPVSAGYKFKILPRPMPTDFKNIAPVGNIGVRSYIECGSIPFDGCSVTKNTTFVKGEYFLPNGILVGDDDGVVLINESPSAPNIVLDCNGSTLIGTMLNQTFVAGLMLFENITVKNCILKNYTTNESGAMGIETLYWGAKIINNTVMNCDWGFNIRFKNIVIGNTLINNGIGMKLLGFDNTFINNTIYGSTIGIAAWGDIPGAPPVVNNTFIGNNISYNNQSGMELHQTHNNKIIGNYLEGNGDCGISLIKGSNNTVVRDNKILNNNCGFGDEYSTNNSVFENIFSGNKYGIYLYSANTSIVNNTISNGYRGVTIINIPASVNGNKIINNTYGVFLTVYESNIINNNLSLNSYGIYFQNANNNSVFHNNFLNNTFQAYSYYSSSNVLDDGSSGNHWSDWTSPDKNEDGIVDNIYNCPIIEGGGYCQDNFPYVKPNGWLLDYTKPIITITKPENKTYNTTNITLEFYQSEDLDVCKLELNGANQTLASCANTTFSAAQGSNSIALWANDTAGNWNRSTTIYFSVDTTPPTLIITSPLNRTYNTTNLTITFNSNGYDKSWYKLNGGSNVLFNNGSTFLANEGSNTLVVYVNDSAGNVNFASVSFSVDTIAPTLTILSPQNITYNSTNITLQVLSTEQNNIDKWWYVLNNGGKIYFVPNTTILGVQGLNNLTVFANDSAGNVGVSAVSFSVSNQTVNQPPTLFPLSNITKVEGQLIRIIANATDNDNLTFFINDSRFAKEENYYGSYSTAIFTWNSTKGDVGLYLLLVNVTDGIFWDFAEFFVNLTLQGDVDKNCIVNIFDLAKVGICYGQSPIGNCTSADVAPVTSETVGDGQINIFDLALVGINFGRGC